MEKITIAKTETEFDEKASWYIIGQICGKPNSVIGLSTGRTTGNMHRLVVKQYKQQPFNVSRITFFGLDEVMNVPQEYAGACYTMLKTEIIDGLGIDDRHFLMLPTKSDNWERDCQRFRQELQRRGGIDLLILGLGENGHLGFNQPGTPFESEAWTSRMNPELEQRIRHETQTPADVSLGGVTLGIKDVNYKSYSEYSEQLLDFNNRGIGSTTLADERRIDGSGFDIKAGIIFRPVETSPFRVGLYVNTPTWYDLKTSNYTELINNTNVGLYKSFNSSEVYEYKLYTPWKFGASLGHTVGNWLALGLTYEYADYSNLDSRYNTGGTYDWYYDNYYEDSESDYVMNNHTESTLKGVHTLKVGGEYMLDDGLSLRVGFNYLSPMYSKDGYKDGSLDSPGSYYASATDYTNWKGTTRVMIGAGYRFDKVSIDFAYQYSQKNGEFSPFMSYWTADGENMSDNVCNAVKLNKERHQLLFTLGYHF